MTVHPVAAVLAGAVTAAGTGVAWGETLAGKARAIGGMRRIAEEQAALRRVAVLVAQGESPEEVFAAVAAEAGQVLYAQHAWIGRYDSDGTLSVVAAWPRAGAALIPVGTRIASGGRNLITLVLQTGRPARFDDYVSATGAAGTLVNPLANARQGSDETRSILRRRFHARTHAVLRAEEFDGRVEVVSNRAFDFDDFNRPVS
jgi:hypothetical protein